MCLKLLRDVSLFKVSFHLQFFLWFSLVFDFQIDVYLAMKELLQKSNQFGGQICQNFQLLAINYLLQGIEAVNNHFKSVERKENLKNKGKRMK